ncbi:MAG: hypothetical protein R6W96_00560 [Clostridia bacterium]
MTDRKKCLEMIADYNATINKEIEKKMDSVSSHGELKRAVEEAGREWEKKTFGSMLPREHFNGIREEDLWGIFDDACRILDDTFPLSFLEVLRQDHHRERLAGRAFDFSDPETCVAALRILGLTGDTGHLGEIIAAILETGEEQELVKETARQALADIGRPALPNIIAVLNARESCRDDDFHLVIALLEICRHEKDDNAYLALKDVFRKTADKSIAASCLAEYGDPRAIPMLRTYLGKNLAALDKAAVLEIKNAVEILGGQVEDLLSEPFPRL